MSVCGVVCRSDSIVPEPGGRANLVGQHVQHGPHAGLIPQAACTSPRACVIGSTQAGSGAASTPHRPGDWHGVCAEFSAPLEHP